MSSKVIYYAEIYISNPPTVTIFFAINNRYEQLSSGANASNHILTWLSSDDAVLRQKLAEAKEGAALVWADVALAVRQNLPNGPSASQCLQRAMGLVGSDITSIESDSRALPPSVPSTAWSTDEVSLLFSHTYSAPNVVYIAADITIYFAGCISS